MKFVLLLVCLLPLAGGAVTCHEALRAVEAVNVEATSLAIDDMAAGSTAFAAAQHRAALVAFASRRDALVTALAKNDTTAVAEAEQLCAGVRAALLANPLLDFDQLLVVQRDALHLGLPANWEGNSSLPPRGYANSISVLTGLRSNAELRVLFSPPKGEFVGDLDLDFDASRLLFSMPAANNRWQVWEMQAGGTAPRQLSLIPDADVDNYGGCFLPDSNVLFSSTATFTGVPCVRGSSHVANLFRWECASGAIRRLTFDQEHNWCPHVMPDGRVLYLRWEYADLPHFVSRILFTMNPDGTEQREFYGSNSYWPNSLFYARPAPGCPTKFFGIVSGHHDTRRMGELVLFDSARGRFEADGVVQRLPGRGKKVEPLLRDRLVSDSWPKFLHPWPLNEKYVLVAAQPDAHSLWGLYLADVFDNLTLIKEVPGAALLEPIPLKARTRPAVIPSKVQPGAKEALVHIADIYSGPGLQGVMRGVVRQLRLFTYGFAYHGMGGQYDRVGLDGPWDVKCILGTVPVAADGSANFRVPANLPIALQPLDADGRALQLMRSWFTAMPGEVVSCAGCHERQNTAPPPRTPAALAQAPAGITPWYGGARGFSFTNEVQPVLDRYCVTCHGSTALTTGGGQEKRPDFRGGTFAHPHVRVNDADNLFPTAYLALKRFVRNATIESDMHLLMPGEFHADTTALVQLLEAGHHGVKLNREAWDRLNTWIDLNAPAHGSWSAICGTNRVARQCERRSALLRAYGGRDDDWEQVPPAVAFAGLPPEPALGEMKPTPYAANYTATAPAPATAAPAKLPAQQLDLGGGVKLDVLQLPAGEFAMGDDAGAAAERPAQRVKMAKPFWIGRVEISNAQFARFAATHDSGIERGSFLQFSERERGYHVDGSNQPVVRVSWHEAQAFCEWLSKQTGKRVRLPTEAQWEYACRAGSTAPMNYGEPTAGFSQNANLADFCFWHVDTFGWGLPSGAVPPWRPSITNVNDGFNVSAPVGSFRPNAWGLCDMHGNAAEWTRSKFQPYPWRDDDGRNAETGEEPRVVRGGAWSDRPAQARASSRLAYPPWRGIFNVGFRIVIEE